MGLAKRSWPEIVVHIPKNLGGGETPSNEQSPKSFGIHAESHSV
jgi:hypothetical protein